MAQPPRSSSATRNRNQDVPDLAELCRLHDVGLDLIERSDDVDDLLDRVLDEYEKRLTDLPTDALGNGGPSSITGSKKLRALIMFATQAVALKTKATSAAELRARAEALELANERLETALREAHLARERLDGVLSALAAGILIVDPAGAVLKANRASHTLLGQEASDLAGSPLPAPLRAIPKGQDGEIVLDRGHAERRVVTVTRRNLESPGDGEVVLLSDVTARDREKEERHRLEKLGEVMRTLGVLSHKINNPLTALLGRAQLLKSNKSADPQVVKAAAVIEESSQRIAELIRELARVVKEGRQEALEKILDMSEQPREEVRP